MCDQSMIFSQIILSKLYIILEMATMYPYVFNGTARIGADNTDRTQKNLMSTQYSNHVLTSYFSDNKTEDYIRFATSQPGIMFAGSMGASKGTGVDTVDVDSKLTIQNENARALEKLSLQQRPFMTVPYLGRGSCDVGLESQLKQGMKIADKKSVSTISEVSHINNQMYPLIDSVRSSITNPKYLVQEAALDGWIRGGSATRILPDQE